MTGAQLIKIFLKCMKLKDLLWCWQQPNNTIQATNQTWPFPEKKYLLMCMDGIRNDKSHKSEKEMALLKTDEPRKDAGMWKDLRMG